MDLIDIVLGVYLALVLHSLTMAWLTHNGTRTVSDGVRCLMDPAAAAAAAQKEYFEWYVDQERRIRERDWQEQQYYQEQRHVEEMSLRGATEAQWNAAQTAWGEVCEAAPGSPRSPTGNPMLPGTGAYTPPAHPQVAHVTQLPTVRGTLQTPVPTTGLPTSAQPMLQPLEGPPDDDDGYGAILSR